MQGIVNTGNLTKITATGFVNMELRLLESAVKKGIPVSKLPSVFLSGPMGVGKSQGVQALAERLEAETGKTVTLTDIRLLLFSPVDLRGIPTVNESRTASRWLLPEIFRLDPSPDVINILFLDELSSCTPAVQAAAYQIVLDHRVGEHRLPENTYVIGAGNRMIDKSVVYKMPKALANRLTHFEVEVSVDEWCDWAVVNGIDHRIVSYIRFKNDMLIKSETDDLAFPTPRSWEMASRYITVLDGSIDSAFDYISGCVGTAAAYDFSKHCALYADIPDLSLIFNGRPAPIKKKTPDMYFALTSAMVAYVGNHPKEYDKIENSLYYADSNFATEFVSYLIHGYFTVAPGSAEVIKKMQAYKDIIRRKGSAFNGII